MLTNQKTGQQYQLQYYYTWLVSAVAGGVDADQSEDRTGPFSPTTVLLYLARVCWSRRGGMLTNQKTGQQLLTNLWQTTYLVCKLKHIFGTFFIVLDTFPHFCRFHIFCSFFYISVVSTLLSFPHGVNWRQLRKKRINTMFVQFVVSYSTMHL